MFGKPVQILVIEDNPADVLLIRESLRDQGLTHEITHYPNGQAALSQLRRSEEREHAYGLVIVDLNMPKLGGLDLLANLRFSPGFECVPFLVLTSSVAPDEQREAKRLGADRFLNKPADLYRFLSDVGLAVREMIDDRGNRDGNASPA